jgi:hypothetical protein
MRLNENAGVPPDTGNQTLPPNTTGSIAHAGLPNKQGEPFRISTAHLEIFFMQVKNEPLVSLRSTAMVVTVHCRGGGGIVFETSDGPAVGLREAITVFGLS